MQAIADGADGVECDVHLTSDGHVVLLHDAVVDRTSNGAGPVAERTLAELRELDFSSWKGAVLPAEYGSIPQQFLTLADLLEILDGAGRPMGLAIEFKHPNPFGDRLEELTLALLTARGWLAEDSVLGNVTVSFMSFDVGAIRYLRRFVPEQHLCQLVAEVDSEIISKELGIELEAATEAAAALRLIMAEGERMLDDGEAGLAGPGVGYLRARLDRVRHWFEAGRRLRVWTVDDFEDAKLCLELGVQEITTNKPAEIRELLAASSG